MIGELFHLVFAQITALISLEEAKNLVKESIEALEKDPTNTDLRNIVVSNCTILANKIVEEDSEAELPDDTTKKELLRLSTISNALIAKKEGKTVEEMIAESKQIDVDGISILGIIGTEEDNCPCPRCTARRAAVEADKSNVN